MFEYQIFMLSAYSGIMHNDYFEYGFLPMIRWTGTGVTVVKSDNYDDHVMSYDAHNEVPCTVYCKSFELEKFRSFCR